MTTLNIIFLLIKKDLLIEFRTRAILFSMLLFSLIILIICAFALIHKEQNAGGIAWLIVMITSLNGLTHLYQIENESDAFNALKIAPINKLALLFSKTIANLIFIFFLEVIALISVLIVFNLTLSNRMCLYFLLIALFSGTGLAITGTFWAFCSRQSRYKEIMLPLFYLPSIIPLLICTINATNCLFTVNNDGINQWLLNIFIFDIIYTLLVSILFERILENE